MRLLSKGLLPVPAWVLTPVWEVLLPLGAPGWEVLRPVGAPGKVLLAVTPIGNCMLTVLGAVEALYPSTPAGILRVPNFFP